MSVDVPRKPLNRVTASSRCENILVKARFSLCADVCAQGSCESMTETGDAVRAKILVSGRVQGVGYRAFVCRMAASRGLTGGVENLDSGQVSVDVEGCRSVLEEFLTDLKRGPVGARVTQVHVEWGNATGRFHDFTIR